LLQHIRGLFTPRPIDAAKEELAALEKEFRTANAGLGESVVRVRPGLDLRVHPECRFGIEHFCFRSLDMVKEMDCFLAEAQDRRRLLDIGALHGMFSLAFTCNQPGKQAIAVDASPLAYAKLLYNAHRNADCAITPIEAAISDSAGVLKMHYEWEHAVFAGSGGHDRIIDVPMMTADELCHQKRFDPDIVKVDVEGHEVKVFRGFTKTLSRCRPVVFLELHPSSILKEGESVSCLAELFFGLRYRARTVAGQPIALAELTRCSQIERFVLTPQD
jgi:FkbM family methyltransferase